MDVPRVTYLREGGWPMSVMCEGSCVGHECCVLGKVGGLLVSYVKECRGQCVSCVKEGG